MPQCIVVGCKNRKEHAKITKLTFHMFPRNEWLKEKWREAIGREESWEPGKHSCICGVHFKEGDFDRSSPFRVYLKKGAIPSVFPAAKTESSELKQERRTSTRKRKLKFETNDIETLVADILLEEASNNSIENSDPVGLYNEYGTPQTESNIVTDSLQKNDEETVMKRNCRKKKSPAVDKKKSPQPSSKVDRRSLKRSAALKLYGTTKVGLSEYDSVSKELLINSTTQSKEKSMQPVSKSKNLLQNQPAESTANVTPAESNTSPQFFIIIPDGMVPGSEQKSQPPSFTQEDRSAKDKEIAVATSVKQSDHCSLREVKFELLKTKRKLKDTKYCLLIAKHKLKYMRLKNRFLISKMNNLKQILRGRRKQILVK